LRGKVSVANAIIGHSLPFRHRWGLLQKTSFIVLMLRKLHLEPN